MLFDAKQFEQLFKEGILKKGLRLFEKGEVELIAKPSAVDYHFLIKESELFLKKKGDRILDCHCSCRHGLYCEHLSAVMFYLQLDSLGISLRTGLPEKKKRSLRPPGYKLFLKALKDLENPALRAFFKDHASELEAKDIRELFTVEAELSLYDFYGLQVRLLLKPYFHKTVLGQNQIDELCRLLNDLMQGFKNKTGNFYFLTLALVTEFAPLFNVRYTGNEAGLFAIYKTALGDLELFFSKGLSKIERQAWTNATLRSVKSNLSLNSRAFVFFIPRFLSISKSRLMFETLNTQLEKRKYKKLYSDYFDQLLIARLELAIRSKQLFKTAFPFKNYEAEPEYTIAQAELEFCRNRVEKGFRHLELKYMTLNTRQKKHWSAFRDYIIDKAHEQKKEEIERRFIKESFIYGLQISPDKLERFLELVPTEEQDQEIKELILDIKKISENFSFDKIATLLFRTQKWDELISELKKQGNKFSLLHQVALNKLPEFDDTLLSLYVKQLLEAVSDKRVHHFQEQLFDHSKAYIDRLPAEVRQRVVSAILNKLGGQSQIYKYITQLYGFIPSKEGH